MLNRVKGYYESNKEVLREKAKNKYRELSEEEKNIKREYGRNRYHNMSEENRLKEDRLKEYQRNYREAKNIFHRCKRSINIKDIDIVIKVNFKIAIIKIFFISASINF